MTPSLTEAISVALAERYVVERELGRGGMASVHLAVDRKHNRPVAVKVLRDELASSLGASRFLREISIAARLQHPNILPLIDSGEMPLGDGRSALYYVMPYVEGETLREHLTAHAPLDVDVAVRLLREIVDALACAHRAGVVHRDIKPENVMLSNGHALIADFGIARAMADATRAETLTGTGMSLGTPAYMAPEQVLADPSADHRVDLYAAGVVAYEMLTGRTPFAGSGQAMMASHVTQSPPPLQRERPDLPRPLASLIDRCLAKDRDDRFPTAEALLVALDSALHSTRPRPSASKYVIGGGIAAMVLFGALGAAWWSERQVRWVHAEAIPQIRQMVDADELEGAFQLASKASAILPDDPALEQMRRLFAHTHVFRSEPEGATVYRARFDDTTRWERIGVTPTDSVRVPAAFARYRFELDGFVSRRLLAGGKLVGPQHRGVLSGAAMPEVVRLTPIDAADTAMVWVDGPALGDPARPNVPRLQPFTIGRYEVSNREYKVFVDSGGYRRQEFWAEPMIIDGRRVGWSDGMKLLVDRSGRPGPATWEAGAPAAGEDDLPVGGLSWYEAAAYARFMGKSLPTHAHWVAAAGRPAAAYVVADANYETTAAARRSATRSVSPWGLLDVAGNVREWTSTQLSNGAFFILGGGWSDHAYRFTDDVSLPPSDRQPLNGVRLASYPTHDPHLAAAQHPPASPLRDMRSETPVSDVAFRAFREMYDFDAVPFETRVEIRDTTHPDWIRETVSFAAGYPEERVRAVLFLPRRFAPPFQTVVLFPAADAFFEPSSERYQDEFLGFIMREGRALLLPVYRGMYERRTGPVGASESVAYRDAVIAWGKDLRRSVDWLTTRAEVDTSRLAYLGISVGGRMGGVMLAIEPRFKAAVLYGAGFQLLPERPEVDPLHFLPHVNIPVLMLNGRYDGVFPLESAQRPFFELLGTPAEHKQHVLFDDAHHLPRAQMIRESLRWFDRYLGSVQR